MPRFDLIEIPKTSRISVGVQVVRNVLNSLFLIAGSKNYQGVNRFISQTYDRLSQKDIRDNEVIMHGLHYAVLPEKDFSNFEEYIDDLKTSDPASLQEKLFHSYDRISNYKVNIISDRSISITKEDQKRILSKKEYYFEYLYQCFKDEPIDYSIEEEAYNYLVKPEELRDFLVAHFQYMWNKHLKDEFENNFSMLDNAVQEFNKIDFSRIEPFEIAKKITGHDIKVEWAHKKWELEWIEKSKKVIFVPSIHMGPYLGRSIRSDAIYIFFSPRPTEAVRFLSPDLTRADISVRLNTLSDDTRLKILKIVAKENEMSSKQVMERLQLCQSAASRHLKQLSATGFLDERRQHSAKIYSLNKKFIGKTLDAVSDYLLKE